MSKQNYASGESKVPEGNARKLMSPGLKKVVMDVHSGTSVIDVRDAVGKRLDQKIIETQAKPLVEYFRGIGGEVHLAFEEGGQSNWLFDLLSPYVDLIVVCETRRNRLLEDGNKSDILDVEKLSELFRAGMLKPVFKQPLKKRDLKELERNHGTLVKETVRTMSRLKAIYRGRA